MMKTRRRQALVGFLGMCVASVLGAFALPDRPATAVTRANLETATPSEFGAWQIDGLAAAFIRPERDLTEWGYQNLVERTYVDRGGRRVMLSMAFGANQSGGLELHLPEICYLYSGFSVRGRHIANVPILEETMAVSRLAADLPQRPEVITYWIVLGGEHIADANTFRLRRLAHAVQRRPADGLLVRVSSLDIDTARAYALHATFIADMFQAIKPADQRWMFGVSIDAFGAGT